MTAISTPATQFSQSSTREITMSRIFDAPREQLFKAYTDPKAIPAWWGPRYLTTTVEAMDVRPGGRWRYLQRDKEGNQYAFNGVYREVQPPERIVSTFEFEGAPGHIVIDTALFEDLGGRTRLTVTSLFDNAEDLAAMMSEGMEAGAVESWERLQEVLDSQREMVISRTIAAPRHLVFAVWTDPVHLVRWWGPNGFTTTTHSVSVVPGGVWRFTMHGPDGVDYPNQIDYEEIVTPERLVYSHGTGEPNHPADFRTTVTFEDLGDKTHVTLRARFASTAELQRHMAFGAVEGGQQTLARLDAHMATFDPSEELSIVRDYDAPLALMWKALSEPAHLAQWWGPKGFEMATNQLDFRPGGRYHYAMRAPNGQEMWGLILYREIAPPERIVFLTSFSDAAGAVLRHPMGATWPLQIENVWRLTEHAGKTRLAMTGRPYAATEEERATFVAAAGSVQQGTQGMLDQLQAHLESALAQTSAVAATQTLTFTRELNAPRDLVWKAWTEPERVRQWWGPRTFASPVCKIDFRVGGTFLFCMRAPDGIEIWNTGVYREIVDQKRIVFTNCFADPEGNVVPATYYGMSPDIDLAMLNTVLFEDVGGKTRLTVSHAGLPGSELDGARVGWNESIDKLAEYLA